MKMKLSRPFEVYHAYIRRCFVAFILHRADSIISVFSILMVQLASFIALWAITRAVGNIGGWGFYDLMLIYSIFVIISALNQSFLDGVWNVGWYVRSGMLDVMLIRPKPIFVQLICNRADLGAIVLAAAGIALLCYSIAMLGITVYFSTILMIILFIVCGVTISTSLYLISNSANFWLMYGNDVSATVQLIQEFARYPMGVFPLGIQVIFTFILPFAFTTFYPASILSGRMPVGAIFYILLATAACVTAAVFVWKKGLKTYNSAGS
jgi:ABC-2 type transport system permease protein